MTCLGNNNSHLEGVFALADSVLHIIIYIDTDRDILKYIYICYLYMLFV